VRDVAVARNDGLCRMGGLRLEISGVSRFSFEPCGERRVGIHVRCIAMASQRISVPR